MALEEELKTLIGIKHAMADARSTLPLVGPSLRFVHDPRSSGPYRRAEYAGTVTANSGLHALVLEDESNQLLLKFETTLISMLSALTFPLAVCHIRTSILCAKPSSNASFRTSTAWI